MVAMGEQVAPSTNRASCALHSVATRSRKRTPVVKPQKCLLPFIHLRRNLSREELVMVYRSKREDLPPTPTVGDAGRFVLPVPTAATEPMSLISMLNASGPTQSIPSPTPQLSSLPDPITRQPSPAAFSVGQFWPQSAAPITQKMTLSIPKNTNDTEKTKLAPMHTLEMNLDSPSEEPRGWSWRKGRKYCYCFNNRTNAYICALISLILLIIMIVIGVLFYPR